MALKVYKPTTPAQRGLVLTDKSELHKGAPVKGLTRGKKSTGGHDNSGHITSRFRGGGHKKKYRVIDFKRNKFDVEATVERLEYDPNRTCHIALIKYPDGELAYIIAPQKISAGDKIISSTTADIKPGNAMPLKYVPVGTIIHNVEMKPGKGGQLARSAGTYIQLSGKDSGYAILKLQSGELRKVPEDCMATIGAVSNPDHQNQSFGKAGRSRWKGRKPHQRGVTMNPVDHPHGGGEGKTSGGRHPVSPWGQSAKGLKTRKDTKASSKLIIQRRKKKKR